MDTDESKAGIWHVLPWIFVAIAVMFGAVGGIVVAWWLGVGAVVFGILAGALFYLGRKQPANSFARALPIVFSLGLMAAVVVVVPMKAVSVIRSWQGDQPATAQNATVKDMIIADLQADGVVLGSPSHYKVAYQNGAVRIGASEDHATVQLTVLDNGRTESSTYPVRRINGFWRLGCEFITLTSGRAEKVWLSWQERLPAKDSSTLIYEFVADNGHCPVGFGPIEYP